jgi:hypothetical protein
MNESDRRSPQFVGDCHPRIEFSQALMVVEVERMALLFPSAWKGDKGTQVRVPLLSPSRKCSAPQFWESLWARPLAIFRWTHTRNGVLFSRKG